MNNRVTLLQAKRLRRLGYNQPCSTYHCAAGNQIKVDKPMNWNAEKRKFWYDHSGEHECTSIPKCDDVINWLKERYGIIINVLCYRSLGQNKEELRSEACASHKRDSQYVYLYPKREYYRDVFAAKRDIITKCLTYIESLSK